MLVVVINHSSKVDFSIYHTGSDIECSSCTEKWDFDRVECFGAVDHNDPVAFSVSVDKVWLLYFNPVAIMGAYR